MPWQPPDAIDVSCSQGFNDWSPLTRPPGDIPSGAQAGVLRAQCRPLALDPVGKTADGHILVVTSTTERSARGKHGHVVQLRTLCLVDCRASDWAGVDSPRAGCVARAPKLGGVPLFTLFSWPFRFYRCMFVGFLVLARRSPILGLGRERQLVRCSQTPSSFAVDFPPGADLLSEGTLLSSAIMSLSPGDDGTGIAAECTRSV